MKKIKLIILIIILLTALVTSCLYKIKYHQNNSFIGGEIKSIKETECVWNNINENYNEQYHRPSKKKAIDNQYNLQSFTNGSVQIINAKDVVYAYYGILKEASNINNLAGCGTIGDAKTPYSYAYDLMSKNYQKRISLDKFEDSFKNIGHISFLTIHPIFSKINNYYYFIEIEVINSFTNKNITTYQEEISYFAYYYGIASIINENNNWKIDSLEYYSEEFLCAPYHNWFYDSTALVNIVYIENLKIVDKITDININNDLIYIYGLKSNKYYRFDFIRTTNGHDILINENIMINGVYTPSNLLSKDWQYLKLTPTKEK